MSNPTRSRKTKGVQPRLLHAVINPLKYLREKEWTMGNGQCRECCGNAPRQGWCSDTVGHRKDCKLAKSIEALGGKVVWEHFNHSKKRRAHRRWWREMWERANDQAQPRGN